MDIEGREKMRRYFNTEGRCKPDIHYMVRLDDRLDKIKRLYIDQGKYFIINRGRQYGKTTTLMALAEYLKDDYTVLPMDFQLMSSANFSDESAFVISFIEYLEDLVSERKELTENIDLAVFENLAALKDSQRIHMDRLFRGLSRLCKTAKKPVVLMIDEVDSASNHQVFLDFLAMLRGYYLNQDYSSTFRSVILAGVYDIKNLKLKLRPEEKHQYNSPWNIAADFDINMSLSASKIAAMLDEYETDLGTGMDTETVAEEIYQYTSGYPYLVSAICKILDEKLPESERFLDNSPWTREGIGEAVKIILRSRLPLFDSMVKQLDIFVDLRGMIQSILYQGEKIVFNPDRKSISIGIMFGFLREKNGQIEIANRIFEMRLLNMLLSDESVKSEMFFYGQNNMNQFITGGKLNMDLVLEKFVIYFTDIYGHNDERFVEAHGRKFFLLYLKPIINGVGNYYIEAQTRDSKRTDVIIDYLGQQFIVELKIWHGNEYHERGEEQLREYLDYYHLEKGYLLSFNFNKKKKPGMREVRIDGKMIVEAVV
jgi:hypothetical protein